MYLNRNYRLPLAESHPFTLLFKEDHFCQKQMAHLTFGNQSDALRNNVAKIMPDYYEKKSGISFKGVSIDL